MLASAEIIKKTGATFTPPQLADFIVGRIVRNLKAGSKKIKILDPACGEGILLSAIAAKLRMQNQDFELLGFDTNPHFLEEAAHHLNDYSHSESQKVKLKQADFLEHIQVETKQTSLFESVGLESAINNTIDVVIANPPYVRTQVLGAEYAQKIAKKFNLKGRVDLYYPFLVGMTYALKASGLIGVITSNRYLTTKSGISVRKFLKEHYDILELIDLGDTKLFDAAVLPAIFIGRKKSDSILSKSHFTKIYETIDEEVNHKHCVSSVYDVLEKKEDGVFKVGNKNYKKTTGIVQFADTKEAIWNLLSKEEAKWIEHIHLVAKHRIGDFFKVRVGIKTTADKVFIRNNWEKEQNQPEKKLLRRLISQENIQPWQISTNNKQLKVLYPHTFKDGKRQVIDLENYPVTKKYLEAHKERLSSRKYLIKAGRKWYEIWVPQNPQFWNLPKIVFPDISPYPRFYFDEEKYIVNGNCYWIVAQNAKEKELLYLVQGIANSKLMTKYHDLMFNNKLYSGRRRYFSQYVEKYPLPSLDSNPAQNIISIVKEIHQSPVTKHSKLIELLELEVSKSYGI